MRQRASEVPMDVTEIKKSFRDLSHDEQLRLLQELWDQLAAESSAPSLSDREEAELRRRLAEHVADPTTAKSWEQVRSEIRGRH